MWSCQGDIENGAFFDSHNALDFCLLMFLFYVVNVFLQTFPIVLSNHVNDDLDLMQVTIEPALRQYIALLSIRVGYGDFAIAFL